MRHILGLLLVLGFVGSAAADRLDDWANLVDDTSSVSRDYSSPIDKDFPVRGLDEFEAL